VLTTPNPSGLLNVTLLANHEIIHPDHVECPWRTSPRCYVPNGNRCRLVPFVPVVKGGHGGISATPSAPAEPSWTQRLLARTGRPFPVDGLIVTALRDR
jgi:hypothetical protein